ncbi:hypothetical protein EZV73_22165 [Acidaminobacter sp. JC074]|uniref:hypothetical protein n=1 Tax=Acidaminobacter sp. JC074 TaxID=2530199 RepID=UPI001F11478E|nr:hypothetical protein [Acidaminobacter sp. JC074]MCH4890304.1 hypothetical protein [Acidaminobacter sp. JC074]
MRRSKFIIGLLVLSMMLMGVGYAAWSQNFNVVTYADSGEINVIIKHEHLGNATELSRLKVFTDVLDDGDPTKGNITIDDDGVAFIGGKSVPDYMYDLSPDVAPEDYTGSVEFYEGWTGVYKSNAYMNFAVLTPKETAEGYNHDHLAFVIEKAYPGVIVESEFKITNKSDYDVVLNCDPTNTFIGKINGVPDTLSQYLIDNNYIAVQLLPGINGKVYGRTAFNKSQDLDIAIIIAEDLPEEVNINGTVYPVEGARLGFELDLVFTINEQ